MEPFFITKLTIRNVRHLKNHLLVENGLDDIPYDGIVERSFPAPKSLAEEAKKAAGRYDKEDVIERLREDFHNKCYICEMKELQEYVGVES